MHKKVLIEKTGIHFEPRSFYFLLTFLYHPITESSFSPMSYTFMFYQHHFVGLQAKPENLAYQPFYLNVPTHFILFDSAFAHVSAFSPSH